jgi:sortase A
MTVTTGQGQFTYRVTDVRRPGDHLPPQLSAGQSLLTLVTAEGDGWRAGWAPDHAVYVDALMQGDTQLPPPGRPTAVSTAERAMQGDPSGFIPLVLWLQLLVVTAIAALWARARWGGPQTWLVAVPILLAGVWGAAASMSVMLPNLA